MAATSTAGDQTSEALALAADFPAATDQAWRALVEKVLNGVPFEKKLVARTYDGLSIKPLYTRADWDPNGDPSGFPGAAPFTRGSQPLGTAAGGWDIRQSHGHPDPAVVNRHILEDLERGVTSIALKVDPAGVNGTAIRSARDLEIALAGVLVDLAPIVFEPTGPSLPLTALFVNLLTAQGKRDAFAGNFGTDPLASLAATGTVITDLDVVLARMGDTTAYIARQLPKARALNVKSLVYHGAGAGEAQELGYAIATAVAYLRVLNTAGLSIDEACGQMAFTVAADADMVLTIAKIRALRRLWGRVAEACGAAVDRRTAPITAVTAPRMFSRRDPWVNILRTTVACFAAGVAGADAITVLPFESALGQPQALGRRIARNTQIVLQEESGLAKVIDPAGGAWTIETLTDQLAAAAWTVFQEVEKSGGMAQALLSGAVARAIALVREARLANVAKRKDPLTGVSEFPHIQEAPVTAEAVDLAAILKARDSGPVGTVGALPAPGSGALMTALVAAAAAGANVPAMSKALVAGSPIKAEALPQIRLGQAFEALRDAGDAFKAKFGTRPKAFLAALGSVAAFTARATYAKNFYEAGGIETVVGTGGTDVRAIAADFKRSGAAFAVICGPDTLYSEHAVALAEALKAAGAGVVHLAGRGGEQEQALRAAGVDGFIFIGCDVPATLDDVYKRLETA